MSKLKKAFRIFPVASALFVAGAGGELLIAHAESGLASKGRMDKKSQEIIAGDIDDRTQKCKEFLEGAAEILAFGLLARSLVKDSDKERKLVFAIRS